MALPILEVVCKGDLKGDILGLQAVDGVVTVKGPSGLHGLSGRQKLYCEVFRKALWVRFHSC